MKRQAKPLSYDLWKSSECLAIAIDSQIKSPQSEEFRAWLFGDSVMIESDGQLFALEGLEPQDLSMIQSGRAIVVEFGLEGPRRETQILAEEPTS